MEDEDMSHVIMGRKRAHTPDGPLREASDVGSVVVPH